MRYKYLNENVVARIDDDGMSRMSCSVNHPDFQDWLAAGNVPDEADSVNTEDVRKSLEERVSALEAQIESLK